MGNWIGGIGFAVMITCIVASSKTGDRIDGIKDPRAKDRLNTLVAVLNLIAIFAFCAFLGGCLGPFGPHLSKVDVM